MELGMGLSGKGRMSLRIKMVEMYDLPMDNAYTVNASFSPYLNLRRQITQNPPLYSQRSGIRLLTFSCPQFPLRREVYPCWTGIFVD